MTVKRLSAKTEHIFGYQLLTFVPARKPKIEIIQYFFSSKTLLSECRTGVLLYVNTVGMSYAKICLDL